MAVTTHHCCTRRRRKSPNWSQLHIDLLESIMKRLSFVDILRFKAVCSSWCFAAEAYVSSSSFTGFLQTPWLMLPSDEEKYTNLRFFNLEENEGKSSAFRFFNLEETRVYEIKDMPKELYESRCVGSSHGWLVHLDKRANPYLLHPFSQARIQLPPLQTFFNTVGVRVFATITELKENFITKAVLSSNPFHSNSNYRVVAIYDQNSKLAFCNHGDGTWTDLGGKNEFYSDIIFYNDQLYALSHEVSVEVWDFHKSFPVKKVDIKPSFREKIFRVTPSLREVCSSRLYLVESSGDLLIIVRFIGDLVNADGQPIEEAELLGGEINQPLICPYRTLLFDVYKVDFNQKKLIEVESLGDCMLFLGGNHSLSLSAPGVLGCKENSIYFTDDYWDRMNEDYLYGGHDMGVFNLEDKSIKPIYERDLCKFKPPPLWVLPNLPNPW